MLVKGDINDENIRRQIKVPTVWQRDNNKGDNEPAWNHRRNLPRVR